MPRIFINLEAGCLQVNLMSTSAQINQLKYTILYYRTGHGPIWSWTEEVVNDQFVHGPKWFWHFHIGPKWSWTEVDDHFGPRTEMVMDRSGWRQRPSRHTAGLGFRPYPNKNITQYYNSNQMIKNVYLLHRLCCCMSSLFLEIIIPAFLFLPTPAHRNVFPFPSYTNKCWLLTRHNLLLSNWHASFHFTN